MITINMKVYVHLFTTINDDTIPGNMTGHNQRIQCRNSTESTITMSGVFDLWRNKLEKPLELMEAQPDDCDYEQLIPPIFNHSTNTRPPKCSNVNIIIRMKHPQIKALNSNDLRFEFTSPISYPLFLKVVKIFNYLWMEITQMKKRQMFRIKNN